MSELSSLFSDKPEVWLFREGRNNNSIIKLGDDVTLKCAIVANPGHHTIVWKKQVTTCNKLIVKMFCNDPLIFYSYGSFQQKCPYLDYSYY